MGQDGTRRGPAAIPNRPDLHQLAVFLKVVETGSFAGAARLLGRSQPAISQAMARLEDIYGGDLFERRRGTLLALTPIGEAILPSARIILDTINEQMVRAVAAAQSRAGSLTLGFFPSLSAGPLRAGVADFTAASPDVGLRMVEALPGELHRQLNERAIDLMIVALTPELMSNALEQDHLWDETLIVALRADHEAASKPSLSWVDISKLPIILRNSHVELVAYRTLLDRIDRQVRLEQHAVSCGTLLDMVGIGMGATVIFQSGAMPHRHVVYRRINEDNTSIAVRAVWRRDDGNPLRHRLLASIRRHAADPGEEPINLDLVPTAPTPDRD